MSNIERRIDHGNNNSRTGRERLRFDTIDVSVNNTRIPQRLRLVPRVVQPPLLTLARVDSQMDKHIVNNPRHPVNPQFIS
jgi:hypothetical protein